MKYAEGTHAKKKSDGEDGRFWHGWVPPAIVTGKLIITGATPRVPLNTALRPRPVGPAVHTAQKLSPQLTCKNTRLVVGVRNRNLVASFWVGREVTWVGQQRGDVLTSGIAFLSFHHRHTPSHFIFLGSRPRHNFQIGILRHFNSNFIRFRC